MLPVVSFNVLARLGWLGVLIALLPLLLIAVALWRSMQAGRQQRPQGRAGQGRG